MFRFIGVALFFFFCTAAVLAQTVCTRLVFLNHSGEKLANFQFHISGPGFNQELKTNANGTYLLDATVNQPLTIRFFETEKSVVPKLAQGCFSDTLLINTQKWLSAYDAGDRDGKEFRLDTATVGNAVVQLRIINHSQKISGNPVSLRCFNTEALTEHSVKEILPGVFEAHLPAPGKYEFDFDDYQALRIVNLPKEISDTLIQEYFVKPFVIETIHEDTTEQSFPYGVKPGTTVEWLQVMLPEAAMEKHVWVKNDAGKYWKSEVEDGIANFYLPKPGGYTVWSKSTKPVKHETANKGYNRFQKEVVYLEKN